MNFSSFLQSSDNKPEHYDHLVQNISDPRRPGLLRPLKVCCATKMSAADLLSPEGCEVEPPCIKGQVNTLDCVLQTIPAPVFTERSPCASTAVLQVQHIWSVLTTADGKHSTRAAVLEMFGPSCWAITVWFLTFIFLDKMFTCFRSIPPTDRSHGNALPVRGLNVAAKRCVFGFRNNWRSSSTKPPHMVPEPEVTSSNLQLTVQKSDC